MKPRWIVSLGRRVLSSMSAPGGRKQCSFARPAAGVAQHAGMATPRSSSKIKVLLLLIKHLDHSQPLPLHSRPPPAPPPPGIGYDIE